MGRRTGAAVIKTLEGCQRRERVRQPTATGNESQSRAGRSVIVNEPDHSRNVYGNRAGAGLARGVIDGICERIRAGKTYRRIIRKAAVSIDGDIAAGSALTTRDGRRGRR